ncbi:MAG: Cof-type HAD-IIB family hydrolase [Lachnospiraceae bacterium]|nr:Cof-type HAD-IIB family hydrolase [Lachnospiraceae bacterium]
MQAIDLHVHSTFSDGTLTPSELVDLAIKSNLEAFALTDHDTTDGIEEAYTASVGKDIEVIPGIEFSTEYKKKDIHILGYYINPYNEKFSKKVVEFRNSREIRNQKMCKKLKELGVDIDYDSFIAQYPDSVITRAHYAKYMISKGIIKTIDEAFDTYIGDNCPGFVPREKISPAKAVSLILSCGGIPVLAHPILYKFSDRDLETLVADLSRVGLKGIETIYSTYSSKDEKLIRKLASKYRLMVTGGSDFHGSNKPNLSLGCGHGDLYIPAKLLPPLKKAYLKGFVPNKAIHSALFFDLDGTLLNDEKIITPITKALLNKACENGHKFIINTGRPLASALKIVERLSIGEITDYIAAFNGGVIYDYKKGEILEKVTLKKEYSEIVKKTAKKYGCHFHTYSDYEILSEKKTKELEYYSKYVSLPYRQVRNVIKEEPTPYKFLIMNFDKPEKLKKVQTVIEQELGNKVFCIFSCDKFLEVIPRESGKGNALKYIMKTSGIKESHSYAFADEENDITLLQAAANSVCMMNGNPKLKAVSDYITFRDNNSDGLADFLELFS